MIVHFVDIGGIYDHRDVGQGMKQTLLYLLYPLFQAEWDRCDQQNHQIYIYVEKGHHLYSGK